MMKLWHVSESPGIGLFEPRVPPASPANTTPVVWAVAHTHLSNYLLPRECPRVCVRSAAHSSDADRRRYIGDDVVTAVIYIETAWLDHCAKAKLWLYEIPTETFSMTDKVAGYWTSERAVRPLSVTQIRNPLKALLGCGASYRTVDRLRPLADEVAASSLDFSIIRLRNAAA